MSRQRGGSSVALMSLRAWHYYWTEMQSGGGWTVGGRCSSPGLTDRPSGGNDGVGGFHGGGEVAEC